MALTPSTKLGPYEIQSPLGAGGMGEVYRALDTRLGRTVAVKVLPTEFSSDEDRLRRFEHEARLLSTLNHPNLLAIYDVGTQDGVHFLVSELLEGESLRQRLEHGPLTARKAVDFGVQMAKGLAAAHEKGIVHRDLKPDNVFVLSDGRVKILDFGLAKQTLEADDNTVSGHGPGTQTGAVLGTAGYMAPEQVRGKPTDARSDIFSLGAILYEMVAGQRAFHGESSVETMNAILKEIRLNSRRRRDRAFHRLWSALFADAWRNRGKNDSTRQVMWHLRWKRWPRLPVRPAGEPSSSRRDRASGQRSWHSAWPDWHWLDCWPTSSVADAGSRSLPISRK